MGREEGRSQEEDDALGSGSRQWRGRDDGEAKADREVKEIEGDRDKNEKVGSGHTYSRNHSWSRAP